MRVIIRILFVLSLTLFCVACGGGGGGSSPPAATSPPPAPPPPPPIACAGADTFPGFLYTVEDTATSPAELHLASSDGCRSELVAILPTLRLGTSAFHMTADGSKGVILWSEDIENQYIVRRLDFTVDISGVLALGQPVTVLPLAGEEALPGDFLSYRSIDIWGDATHDLLYVTMKRQRSFNSGPNAGEGTRVALIYDLNDLTDVFAVPDAPDVREIYNMDASDWQDADELDCSSIFFPQFVPTCYRPQTIRFNPSGTRLYIGDNINDPDGQRWDATMRIHIDMGGGPALADWTLTGPELVYTGTTEHEPSRMLARPDNDPSQLPSPENIAMTYLDRSGNQIQVIGAILDADQCAADYAPYADGTSEAQFDLWQGCLGTSTFFVGFVSEGGLHGGGDSWQSPEALLRSAFQAFQDPDFDIYRRYVTGALAGTEQLVIENARFGDSGN